MRQLLNFCLFVLFSLPTIITAQTAVIGFNFSGNSGNEASVNSFYNAPNILPSSITRGAGLNSCTNGDRFCATAVNANTLEQAITQQEYFEFTLQHSITDCDLNFNSITVKLQRSNTGAQQIALRSSVDNFTSNIDAVGTISASGTTTITFTSSFTLSATTTFRFYIYSASGTGGTVGFEGGSGTIANPDILVQATTDCETPTDPTDPSTPSSTIIISNLSANQVNVDCASTVNPTVTVQYTSNATFLASNSFTVELSTPTGVFPGTNVLIDYSFSTDGTLIFEIPSLSINGNYLIRVKSLSPSITSNTLPITITEIGSCIPVPPHLRSILYDGCDGPCGTGVEGLSEILFGNSGTYSFIANSANIDLQYSTGGYNLTTAVVSNPSKIAELNNAASCPGLFIDANQQTIPANSTFLLVSENICIDALDWSTLCGTDPIYVIFGRESTSSGWRRGGNFGNSGGAKKFYLRIVTTENTNTVYYTYTPITQADGNYATYNVDNLTNSSSSNPITPSSTGNFPDCSLSLVALDQKLYFFTAIAVENVATLLWKIKEDKNTSHYILDKYDARTKSFIECKRTTTDETEGVHSYQVDDINIQHGDNIFRLTVFNYDGQISLIAYTALEMVNEELLQIGNFIYSKGNQTLELYTVDGRSVPTSRNSDSIEIHYTGIVIIHDSNQQKTYRFFINGK